MTFRKILSIGSTIDVSLYTLCLLSFHVFFMWLHFSTSFLLSYTVSLYFPEEKSFSLCCSRRCLFTLFLESGALLLTFLCLEIRTYSTFWIKLDSGFGGSCRGFNSTTSPEESVIKLEEEQRKIENEDSFFEEEISKLRREFTAAKQSFLKIPEAVKAMPKMNPEGHSLYWLIIFLLRFGWIYFVFHDLSNFYSHFILKLGIYVNKNLRLDSIQVYGFDYDYTLAHYSSNLQNLIYDLAKEHMVNEVSPLCPLVSVKTLLLLDFCLITGAVFQLRYPESCLEFKYDSTFPIRGLYYDRQKGCLLKLDFFGSIEPDGCYFGRQKVWYINFDQFEPDEISNIALIR